jgi:uncharacterized iron-regulated membrane protein
LSGGRTLILDKSSGGASDLAALLGNGSNAGQLRMEDDMASRTGGINTVLAFLLGVAVVALIVLGYLYYRQSQRDVVKINVPGFQGEITRQK